MANTSSGAGSIAGYTFNGTSLSAISDSPFGLDLSPSTVAITPNNLFLYEGNYAVGGMFAYAIGAGGTLTVANNNTAVDSADFPYALAVDPTSKFLIMEQLSGAGLPFLNVFSINQTTGGITPVGTSLQFSQGSAGQIYFVPNTNLVCLTEGSGGFDILSFNSTTGTLTPLNIHYSPPSGSTDIGVASDPKGQYLFVSETVSQTVKAFTLNATTGAITANGSVPQAGGPHSLLVDSTGAYLYVTLFASAQVAAYSISATGTLTQLPGSPFATGTAPDSLAEDASGSYLLVGTEGGSPDFQVFSIAGATASVPGALTSMATASTGGGTEPAIVSGVLATH